MKDEILTNNKELQSKDSNVSQLNTKLETFQVKINNLTKEVKQSKYNLKVCNAALIQHTPPGVYSEGHIYSLTDRINSLQTTLRECTADNEDVKKDIVESRQCIVAQKKQISTLIKDIDKLRTAEKEYKQNISDLNKELNDVKAMEIDDIQNEKNICEKLTLEINTLTEKNMEKSKQFEETIEKRKIEIDSLRLYNFDLIGKNEMLSRKLKECSIALENNNSIIITDNVEFNKSNKKRRRGGDDDETTNLVVDEKALVKIPDANDAYPLPKPNNSNDNKPLKLITPPTDLVADLTADLAIFTKVSEAEEKVATTTTTPIAALPSSEKLLALPAPDLNDVIIERDALRQKLQFFDDSFAVINTKEKSLDFMLNEIEKIKNSTLVLNK